MHALDWRRAVAVARSVGGRKGWVGSLVPYIVLNVCCGEAIGASIGCSLR